MDELFIATLVRPTKILDEMVGHTRGHTRVTCTIFPRSEHKFRAVEITIIKQGHEYGQELLNLCCLEYIGGCALTDMDRLARKGGLTIVRCGAFKGSIIPSLETSRLQLLYEVASCQVSEANRLVGQTFVPNNSE